MATDAVHCDDGVWLDVERMDIERLRRAVGRRTEAAQVPCAIDIVLDGLKRSH